MIGDVTTARQRADDPSGWAFDASSRDALSSIVGARRDIRRYRPDPVAPDLVREVLAAGHAAPSVGHSQPWRFITVSDPSTRDAAAALADRARHRQAAALDVVAGQHLLDLQLDGIREAPLGIIVCCDRRVTPVGVLGRATLHDADLWSCACAIQNMWLTARAAGLGMGWVTLFEPEDLVDLFGLPDGVVSLGWLCLGYPDERPPEPGLVRAGWSSRLDLDDVTIAEHWPDTEPLPPRDRVRGPGAGDVVATRDDADSILTPPGSLGRLDHAVDRVIACCGPGVASGTLVLVGGDHPVADLGVTAYSRSVTAEVMAAARAGESIGVVSAATAGLRSIVVDAGASAGNLVDSPAMTVAEATERVDAGAVVGEREARSGLVVLGEVGIGNTTVAAALVCALLDAEPSDVVGLGAGIDSTMLARKRAVVAAALARARPVLAASGVGATTHMIAELGGPEVAFLAGVITGVARAGGVVVLDGMVTGAAAL
ncbi:MAG: cob(II)yrinic acid a,c-diamide reductase, partial [Ilumatobacteraceae bacterium]|nr:cob(II)yrinic acid a,c-diamide reductase [Ilumatobacteraceae bacterium]